MGANAVVTGRVATSPQRGRAHWTMSRLRAAKPLPATASGGSPSFLTGSEGRASSAASSSSSPSFVAPARPGARSSARLRSGTLGAGASASAVVGTAASDYSAYPNSANGALVGAFVTSAGEQQYRCSASVINSGAGNLVLTAGHCVIDPETGAVARWLVFVPAYHDGTLPFGEWAATEYAVPASWQRSVGSRGSDEAGDFAILRIQNRESDGAHLQNVVGALGIGFNQPRNQTYSQYGYPAESPYNGEGLYQESAEYVGSDSSFSPATIGVRSDFTEGASGGPWTVGTESPVALSVTAYTYKQKSGYLFGPYFGRAAESLYRRADSEESKSASLRLTGVEHLSGNGSIRLRLAVPGAGTVRLRGSGIRPVTRSVRRSRTLSVPVRAGGATRTALRERRQATVGVRIEFRDDSGNVERLTRTIRLVLKS